MKKKTLKTKVLKSIYTFCSKRQKISRWIHSRGFFLTPPKFGLFFCRFLARTYTTFVKNVKGLGVVQWSLHQCLVFLRLRRNFPPPIWTKKFLRLRGKILTQVGEIFDRQTARRKFLEESFLCNISPIIYSYNDQV